MSDDVLTTIDFINTFGLLKPNYSCNRQFMVHYIVRWGDSSEIKYIGGFVKFKR